MRIEMRKVLVHGSLACAAMFTLTMIFTGPDAEIRTIYRDNSVIFSSEARILDEQLEAKELFFQVGYPGERLALVYRERRFAVYTIVRAN